MKTKYAKVREYFTITEKAPNRALNVKALVGAFNQEKALVLVGAFSVILKSL